MRKLMNKDIRSTVKVEVCIRWSHSRGKEKPICKLQGGNSLEIKTLGVNKPWNCCLQPEPQVGGGGVRNPPLLFRQSADLLSDGIIYKLLVSNSCFLNKKVFLSSIAKFLVSSRFQYQSFIEIKFFKKTCNQPLPPPSPTQVEICILLVKWSHVPKSSKASNSWSHIRAL